MSEMRRRASQRSGHQRSSKRQQQRRWRPRGQVIRPRLVVSRRTGGASRPSSHMMMKHRSHHSPIQFESTLDRGGWLLSSRLLPRLAVNTQRPTHKGSATALRPYKRCSCSRDAPPQPRSAPPRALNSPQQPLRKSGATRRTSRGGLPSPERSQDRHPRGASSGSRAMFRSAAVPLAAVLGAGAGGHFLLQGFPTAQATAPATEDGLLAPGPVPTRAEQLTKLRTGTKDRPFDVLVIGGGATGTGCALDAATRCALLAWHPATKNGSRSSNQLVVQKSPSTPLVTAFTCPLAPIPKPQTPPQGLPHRARRARRLWLRHVE
jgi:hypothetical protein